jgi:hypothetical protein
MQFPTPPTIDVPRWAYSTGADILEPSDSQKMTGWVAVPGHNYAPPPPYQIVNWLNYSAGEWINYIATQFIPSFEDSIKSSGVILSHLITNPALNFLLQSNTPTYYGITSSLPPWNSSYFIAPITGLYEIDLSLTPLPYNYGLNSSSGFWQYQLIILRNVSEQSFIYTKYNYIPDGSSNTTGTSIINSDTFSVKLFFTAGDIIQFKWMNHNTDLSSIYNSQYNGNSITISWNI